MKTANLVLIILLVGLFVLPAYILAASIEFELVAHPNNAQLLPQPKGLVGVSGDHLLQTADDITGSTFNPNGCFSFNFMNPVGISEPDYPPGYAEGIHSMSGLLVVDINLQDGGSLSIESLTFNGHIAPSKFSVQRLVQVGDPATSYNTDGVPNGGMYMAAADANWAFQLCFDWYYDTSFAGSNTIDITFDNYQWNGFIIPVSKLNPAGMAATVLDDPLSYFGGISADFESWLLDEVAPRLPQDATCLLFAQGEAHPAWRSPMMGMQLEGIVGETIIGYTVAEFSPNKADIDGDWDVDLLDYTILADQWQQVPGEPSADIDPPFGDGIVDINDLAFLVENWLWGVSEPNGF